MDPQSKNEFARWTDLSGQRLKIEVWGKVGLDWHGIVDADGIAKGKGKGKEKEQLEDESGRPEWKVLEEWNINLADLVPLPEHVSLQRTYSLSYALTWSCFVGCLSPLPLTIQYPPGDISSTWPNLLPTTTHTNKSFSITFNRIHLRPRVRICEREKRGGAHTSRVVAWIFGDWRTETRE
jgi:hypothetical protein